MFVDHSPDADIKDIPDIDPDAPPVAAIAPAFTRRVEAEICAAESRHSRRRRGLAASQRW